MSKYLLRASLACASLAAGLAPDIARAEEDSSPIIIVTGMSASEEAEAEVRQTPGGADVVTHQDYADKSLVSLRDALAFSPGVYLQPRFGQEVRISIRGSGLSRGFHMRGITLLQDGVPINLADDNGDFQELEPAFFDHLQVYRGANALRFGSGTLGGAINGVTPTGRTSSGLYARVDAGSFDFARGLISFGAGDERADVWAAISADGHDGDRLHAKRDSVRFHGNVGLALSDVASTRFYASVTSLDQQLPGALNRQVVLSAPRTGNFVGNQARDIDSLRVQNRTRFDWGTTSLELGLFLNAKELYHPIFQVVDQVSTDRGAYARLEKAGERWELTIGGESRWGNINAKRFVNLNGRGGTPTLQAEQDARTSSLYGELRYRPVDALTLVVGGIFADGYRKQAQLLPSSVTGSGRFSAFSSKFGALWQPTPDVQFYANYNRSVEFPTFVELAQVAAFVPIKEQMAWTAEIGSRGKAGPLSWDISLYRAAIRGEMLQFTVGPDIPASTFNAGRTRHQGVEAALSFEAASWLRFRQLWQYSDFHFVGDRQYGDNRLPVIPENVLRSEIRIGGEAAHLAPNLEWVPQGAWADYRNSVRSPGYALLGVTAGARLGETADLFLDIRNLLGEKAIGDVSAVIAASPASVIYYPVERRAIYGGIRARF
jgi:iron complex outermembrane recepter protein